MYSEVLALFGNGQQRPQTLGQYDYGNGRSGTHPIRRRIAPGPPPWIRQPLVEPVTVEANEHPVGYAIPPQEQLPRRVGDIGPFCSVDAIHGERDRSFEDELAGMEVWD